MGKRSTLISRFLWLTFIATVGLMACTDSQNPKGKTYSHFDVKSFLNEEASFIEKGNFTFEKTVSLNGKEEIQTFDSLDFKLETQYFLANDINKPSYFGRYEIDTLLEGNNTRISYTALDEDLKTRRLVVEWEKETVQTIKIENASKGIVYNSSQQLNFIKGKGFTIKTVVNPRLEDEKEFGVNVTYLQGRNRN